jgi:predicted transcriptional regulator
MEYNLSVRNKNVKGNRIMEHKEEIEQLLLIDANKKYIDLLRAVLSWRNISNRQVAKNTKIPESTVSKILSGKVISKKLYHKTISILLEQYNPIDRFREIIDKFDVVDKNIQTQLDFLEDKQMKIIELNRRYYKMKDPFAGN